MKHCVQYPDDKFLAVRPCLVAICFGNRPAAKLLGTLLYRYNLRVENKDDAENINAVKSAKGEKPDQDTTYRIFRKQSQLVEDMCGEMTEKTMHDVAVPMLQLLGFIDLEEHMQSNCYIVDIDLVQQALNFYCPTAAKQTQLETFLISVMQLEKFLITQDELETFLIDKKLFLSGLEKVLIQNRNVSNHKRGRKAKPELASRRVLRRRQNLKEDSKKNSKIDYVSADAERTPASSECDQEQAETLKALQAGLIASGVIAESPIATTDTTPTLLQAEQERDMHNGHGNTHHHGTGDSGDRGTLLPLVSAGGSGSTTGTQAAQEVIPIGVDKSQDVGDKSSKGKKPPKPKDEKLPPSKPVEPLPDMAWGTRKCLQWFDFWRGGILIGKYKLMQAATCAKGLAEQFSEVEVIQYRTDMNNDPYYVSRGGCDICDVASNIHKYRAKAQKNTTTVKATIGAVKSGPMPRANPTYEELRREAF